MKGMRNMKITMEKMIAKLNDDIEWEYQALIQYIQHASLIAGAQYDAIQKELLIHATEEHNHAVLLSTQIVSLGGFPSVKIKDVKVSKKSLEMLRQDLAGEIHAVERYKERIYEAEQLREYGLRRILEDILIQEEEHKRDLQNAIEQAK